ncbi:hypothetical protein Acit_00290 [Aciditerrimonas ferrireducens]|nr:hypothetical protein [Aciditerrimonas ferrireducens]MCK4175958.1 hypothetical protein [Aciditerrimonas ferrireducens]
MLLVDQLEDRGPFQLGHGSAEAKGDAEERSVVLERGCFREVRGHLLFDAVDTEAEVFGQSHAAESAQQGAVAGCLLKGDVLHRDWFWESTWRSDPDVVRVDLDPDG